MKWFKHTTDVNLDAKKKKLLMRYGVNGYGLFYYCVEIIAGCFTSENITFELEHDSQIIAHDLKMDSAVVEEIMKYCIGIGLFQFNNRSEKIVYLGLMDQIDNSTSQSAYIKNLKCSENFKQLKDSDSRVDKSRVDKSKTRARRDFIPPTIEEVKAYIVEHNYSVDPVQFFNYYNESGWKDARGNPVRNWKQKIITWHGRAKKDAQKDTRPTTVDEIRRAYAR